MIDFPYTYETTCFVSAKKLSNELRRSGDGSGVRYKKILSIENTSKTMLINISRSNLWYISTCQVQPDNVSMLCNFVVNDPKATISSLELFDNGVLAERIYPSVLNVYSVHTYTSASPYICGDDNAQCFIKISFNKSGPIVIAFDQIV